MISGFLRSRGFDKVRDERKRIGATESQTVYATNPGGDQIAFRIKLCWRRRNSKETFSAAQILANIKGDDWEGSLRRFIERTRNDGATHFLFVQREGQQITAAAQVPIHDLLSIWCEQRDRSAFLIEADQLGRRKKNHAMNGSSPTLWLRDDVAPTVVAALWEHPGVHNLVDVPITTNRTDTTEQVVDDTYDDMPGLDYSLLGSDGAARITVIRSHVKRDPRIRSAVLVRSKGKCEREECGTSRAYSGFLDVHHILGAETSDRVWNCVAICPNCHREAHMARDRDQINAALLAMAMRWKKASS